MNRLHQLPEIIDRQLGELTADANLLARIKNQKAQKFSFDFHAFRLPAIAVCTAAVVLVCTTLLLPSQTSDHLPQSGGEGNLISSHSAGDSIITTQAPDISASIPSGVITLGVSEQASSETLFETGVGSNFPLITINGITYRMLSTPTSISTNMLGDSLGTITEFTLEPALGRSGLVSNIVPTGTEVFEIAGMKNALIASSIDGFVRVFQRVSYANTAIIGKETLSDTLCDTSDVVWISLQDVGILENPDDVALVMNTLFHESDFASSSMTGNRSLQIGLRNGLTLQLLVGDDTVSACGTWNAPDFFDAFESAVTQ